MSISEDVVATPRAQGHPPIICLEGNGSRPSHLGGGYSTNGVMFTLNAVEHHAVVYSLEGHTIDRRSSQNGRGWAEGYVHTLNSTDRHAVVFKKEETHDKGLPTSDMQLHPVHRV